jgi:protoporphyrinogen oxidase
MKRVIGNIDPTEHHVNIWGAGFSGLILGYFLKEQGYKVTIYEKANKVGGKIQTKKIPGGLAEKGANALYLNADCVDLLKDLKLEPLPATKKLKRLIMVNGKPRRPLQPGLLSAVALHGHKKPPLITDGLTVAEFFRPLIGQDLINKFVTPVFSGIYATPAEALHFKTVFHQVENKAQFESYWDFIKMIFRDHKSRAMPKTELSGSVSFEGGMQVLINRLAEVLKADIKVNYKEPLRLKGNTIVCTDAQSAAELTRELRPEISAELARIRYQEMTSVTVLLKREIKSLNKSFGVVVPLDTGFNSIGILNNKAVFPSNNENVIAYTFISRKNLSHDDVIHDLQLLNPEIVPEEVDHMEITNWEKALPIYDLQLYLAVKKLHQLSAKEKNFAIFGNYVAGISLREMISAAKHFAKNPQY